MRIVHSPTFRDMRLCVKSNSRRQNEDADVHVNAELVHVEITSVGGPVAEFSPGYQPSCTSRLLIAYRPVIYYFILY
jgi:hypothetical protein